MRTSTPDYLVPTRLEAEADLADERRCPKLPPVPVEGGEDPWANAAELIDLTPPF